MIPEQQLSILRACIESLVKDYPNLQAFVVGSQARHDAQRSSDVDVLLDAGAPIPGHVLVALDEALENSDFHYRVDLIDRARAPEGFVANVMKDAQPIRIVR